MAVHPIDPELAGAFAHCENLLRERDRTSWLACLFTPQTIRPHLHALLAFDAEVLRIPAIVSEPALGEIRLQWWREVVRGERSSEASANPSAAALLDTIKAHNLPRDAFENYIEARRFDFYQDPMPSISDMEGYCGETSGALLRLAAIILCGGEEPGGADVCGHAGVALGVMRLLQELPRSAGRGQCYVPKDVLERNGALVEAVAGGVVSASLFSALAELRSHARAHLAAALSGMAQMDSRAKPALVSLALVQPVLKKMEQRSYQPFVDDTKLSQWRSQWAMWRW